MTRRAAIDIGTNTVRLLVADLHGDDVPTHVLRDLEITRLGSGVDASRRLEPAARDRTLAAVGRFAERATDSGAESIRVAGTSALRDAEDADAFARAVRDATGAELEILDGREEGRLAFLGATSDLHGGPFVVCDIGGGSTELIRGVTTPDAICSLDVGSVRIRERCLPSDPPTPEEIAHARSVVDDALAEADAVVVGDEMLIGVAGTVTTLGALHRGLDAYDPEIVHGTTIGADDVEAWARRLLATPTSEMRERWPVIEPGRVDVIGAGALVCSRVVARWGSSELRVSERDILDGLVIDGSATVSTNDDKEG